MWPKGPDRLFVHLDPAEKSGIEKTGCLLVCEYGGW